MILAVADYAEGKGSPPPPLALALNCRRWQTLPEPGGWREQYAMEMMMLNACLNVYDIWTAYKAAQRREHGSEFLAADAGANALIGRILALDLERSSNG
jgi:hypothetical protein